MRHLTRRRARIALVAAACTAVILTAGTAVAAGTAGLTAPAPDAPATDGDRTASVREAIVDGPATNVILLVGDGMGDSEITIARNYGYGAAGRLPGIDALPLTGQYTTFSLHRSGARKGTPDYAPDSAATATAWATGSKTYDRAISVGLDGTPLPTVVELAKRNGLRTGVVTTARVTDATPAVQVAHVASRTCQGPDSSGCGADALTRGGRGSIAEQLLATRPDLVLGGGRIVFRHTANAGRWKGESLVTQARARGFRLVTDAAGLTATTWANADRPLLGLFTADTFPTRFAPSKATVGGADRVTTCRANPSRLPDGLTLAALTSKAISLLDAGAVGGKGFFLQVEGASIDKRDHAADACGQIGETLDFDRAVQAALRFARTHGNTLVLVTADHAHSSQIVDVTPAASLSTAVKTREGGVMKISYGTAPRGGAQQHTGSQVRIAGFGPGAANIVGLTDQTDTFTTIIRTLGVDTALERDPGLGLERDHATSGPRH